MTEVSISATKDGKRQQRKPELNRLMARSDVALGSTTWVSLEGPAMLSELDMLVKIGREGKRKTRRCPGGGSTRGLIPCSSFLFPFKSGFYAFSRKQCRPARRRLRRLTNSK